jgi:hypothetical protein
VKWEKQGVSWKCSKRDKERKIKEDGRIFKNATK